MSIGGRWIDHWTPEDPRFWKETGARIANRNLWFSILTEHLGFSLWSLWSVMVLFMGPAYGFSAADKFWLTSLVTLVGSAIRLPYTLAPARFGGRNWTVVSALLLLVPAVAAGFVMHPGVSFGTMVVVAILAGLGGGNFASSMANINTFFPEGRKGWALGLNAGGGNLGVAAIQLVGLAVIAVSGTTTPQIILWIYTPLIVVAAVCAALFMDNISSVRNDTKAFKEALADVQTWVMSFLYVGTFGSFIGYSFAFGLVLQNQFGRTPLQAASVTFLGPLVGSLIRPVGGWLADRYGGAKVSLWNYLAMAVSVALIMAASQAKSLAVFTAGFIALFFFSGLGNGSTYKMIPAIFRAKAKTREEAGVLSAADSLLWSRRISGAVIGIAGAIGAFGGVLINLAFRQSFLTTKSGMVAFTAFLVFYVVCIAVTYFAYLRKPAVSAKPAYAKV
ncbi:nitrate/nitrite transporter [Fodinicola acaciae]|uniref:nitrate/nitrite transporter n=1 Tax=Fodinicola acaciae TaxID=2681555 RepID=UPI001C9E3462|nr:nitrate/nitrite transporter [Fodinicola acaciae]